jgi:hypothetical protein
MTQKQDPNLANLARVQPKTPKTADKSKRAQNLRANMLKRKEQMAARAQKQD